MEILDLRLNEAQNTALSQIVDRKLYTIGIALPHSGAHKGRTLLPSCSTFQCRLPNRRPGRNGMERIEVSLLPGGPNFRWHGSDFECDVVNALA
jgi:hypothetical protein